MWETKLLTSPTNGGASSANLSAASLEWGWAQKEFWEGEGEAGWLIAAGYTALAMH